MSYLCSIKHETSKYRSGTQAYTYLNRLPPLHWCERGKKRSNNKKKLVATVIQHKNMNKTTLATALATIAAANPAGYTVNARTLEPLTSGYAVAVAATQNSFGPEGLQRVIEYAATHKEIAAFGGWLNKKSGLYYFDAVIICEDLTDAMELARVNKQIAFFDLNNKKEVRL